MVSEGDVFLLFMRAFRHSGVALSAGALPRPGTADPQAGDGAPPTDTTAETEFGRRAPPFDRDDVYLEGEEGEPRSVGGVQLMKELMPVYERLEQMGQRYRMWGVGSAR